MFMRYLLALIAVLVLAPVLLVLGLFQPEPLLGAGEAVSPYQAARGQELLSRSKDVADGTDPSGQIEASEADFNALFASLARVIKPLHGNVEINQDRLRLQISAKIPDLEKLGWINFDASLGPSERGLNLTALKLGSISLPPRLTLWALTTGLDLATPDDFGSLFLQSVRFFTPSEGIVRLGLDAGGTGDDSLYGRALTQFGSDTPPELDAAKVHYDAMTEAVLAGALNRKGSVTPWLRFALNRVAEAEHATPEAAREDLGASLLALAAHCGGLGVIENMVGKIEAEHQYCLKTRLHRRQDLRKHFIISAALQGMTGSTASFGLGEVKELVDSGNISGSGFSFDDIAADRAGIRFSEAFKAASPDDYLRLIEQLSNEGDYMPHIKDLPRGLSAEEFIDRFGSVDSPAYQTQIEQIDQRIDALPLHRS